MINFNISESVIRWADEASKTDYKSGEKCAKHFIAGMRRKYRYSHDGFVKSLRTKLDLIQNCIDKNPHRLGYLSVIKAELAKVE